MVQKCEPIGAVAVRMGYCRPEDIQLALALQEALPKEGKPHKLLGMILLENGLISADQLIGILKYYQRHNPV